jgi:hypothetical protein
VEDYPAPINEEFNKPVDIRRHHVNTINIAGVTHQFYNKKMPQIRKVLSYKPEAIKLRNS